MPLISGLIDALAVAQSPAPAAAIPDEAALARMIAPGVPDQATRKLITRTFTNFKAGR